MLSVRLSLPVGDLQCGKSVPRTCLMQAANFCKQPRHGASCGDRLVKLAVRSFQPVEPGLPATVLYGGFGSGQMLECYARHGVTKRQRFERGTHLRNLQDIAGVEPGDADATARLDNHQPLGLEPLERLPHRDVTDAVCLGHLILQQTIAGLQSARDDLGGQVASNVSRQRPVIFRCFLRSLKHGVIDN